MLIKNNFFLKSKKFNSNLDRTKKSFYTLKSSLKDFSIPVLGAYDKNYELNFSSETIKKFSKFKNIFIIGMGGSILGTKSIYSFFKKKIKKKLFFFDNLDANLHFKLNNIKNFNNSCFVVVSKSGNTLETIANFSLIFSKYSLKNKLIFITEMKDSNLVQIADKLNAEIIEHKDFIGGRYSVLSEVGMFPAALMGLKINEFRNLDQLINDRNFVSSLIYNVAGIYTLNNQRIKNSVILNYDSDLNNLGYWYQQLVSESLGKKGKGITTIISPAPKDHHSLLQLYLDGPKDKFFTFFNSSNNKSIYKLPKTIIPNSAGFIKNKKLESIINAQCNATKNIFKSQDIPFRNFIFNKNSERELGKIFTFFVLETILLADLMKINPYDQPAVEKVKIETKKILLK